MSAKLSWEKLKSWDCSSPDIAFARDDATEALYTAHKENLKKTGISLDQYVEKTVLGDQNYVLSANRFPYNVEVPIRHFVFWMRPGYKVPTAYVKNFLQSELRTQVVVFENVPVKQTIRGIPHYQVFILGP